MAKLDLLEHFLHAVGRPVGNFLHQLVYHPAETVIDCTASASEWVQDHPYTCVALVGLGAYAYHRGWIKANTKRVDVNFEIDTCLGGYRTNTSAWVGKKNR